MLVNGVATTVKTHNTLLDVFVTAGLWQTAHEHLDTMSSFGGVQPDIISYNTVLGGCLSFCQRRHARQVLSSMERDRIAADCVSYNSLIKGSGTFQWASSNDILCEIESQREGIGSEGPGGAGVLVLLGSTSGKRALHCTVNGERLAASLT